MDTGWRLSEYRVEIVWFEQIKGTYCVDTGWELCGLSGYKVEIVWIQNGNE